MMQTITPEERADIKTQPQDSLTYRLLMALEKLEVERVENQKKIREQQTYWISTVESYKKRMLAAEEALEQLKRG